MQASVTVSGRNLYLHEQGDLNTDIAFSRKVPFLEPDWVFALSLGTLFKSVHPLLRKVKEMKGIFNYITAATYC